MKKISGWTPPFPPLPRPRRRRPIKQHSVLANASLRADGIICLPLLRSPSAVTTIKSHTMVNLSAPNSNCGLSTYT